MGETKPQTTKMVQLSYRLERLLGENVYLLILAAIIGVAGGFGAVLFKEMIYFMRDFSFYNGASHDTLAASPWYLKVLPPAVGGLVVGPLIYFFAREAKGHGIPNVMNTVSNRGGRIRKRVVSIKTIASAITIGTGGSAGREGPIVQIGAGVGSTVGQVLGFEGNRLITMLGCGAAAGMAATFNAPIAGVIVAVEIIIGSVSISVFSPLVVASVAGTVVTRAIYGDETFINVPEYALQNPAVELPLYLLLGVLAGVASLAFTKGIVFFEDLWEKLPIPEWLSPMIGGAIVGAIALVFPHVLGVGYETIDDAVHGREALWVLAALVIVKIVASGTTLGSGGSGGVFAPSLFVGAALGGAFGLLVERWLPGQTANSGAYALVGMGAVLAGSTHAPITAIIMLFELTTDYSIILPLMLSCIISLVISSRVMPTSIFTTRLLRRGVKLRSSSEAELMRVTRVRQLLREFPETMAPNTPISQVLKRTLGSSREHQYVVDGEHRLLGVITLRRIRSVLGEEGMDDVLMLAADVMKSPVTTVSLDDTLEKAMAHISRLDTEMLPVLDEEGRIAGSITRHDIMVFFDREILKNNALGMKFVQAHAPEEAQFVELAEGQQIRTMEVTDFLHGKTIRQLDLRATTGINVVAILHHTSEGVRRKAPGPESRLHRGDQITVVGEKESIDSFARAILE